MSARLDVRADTFYEVANTVLGDALAAGQGPELRLVATLGGCAGMAGSDPVGRDWSAAYDEAARTVVTSTRQLCDAMYHAGVLVERTGVNYEHAEAASTAGGGAPVTVLLHDPQGRAVLDEPPSAAGGGSTDAPTGWGLVEDMVGYVWPNGHQDRLHRAAAAWEAAGAGLDDAAGWLLAAGCEVATVHCPEVDAVVGATRFLREQCDELAHAHRTLGRACRELAEHLDRAHDEARDELTSLVAFTVGTEAVGAVLSVVSFGAAEVPTQAAVATRIGLAATRLRTLFAGMSAAVRVLAGGLPGTVEVADTVAMSLQRLLRLRPALATVEDARALPMLSRAKNAARGTSGGGKVVPRAPVTSKANSPVWQGFKPYRGKTRTNGKTGKDARFYEWDHTHGDIEVYDAGGKHLGSMDATTGDMSKPAVTERSIGD